MQLKFKLSLSAIIITILAACSSEKTLRQASNDFTYLKSAPLSTWQTLPNQKSEFSNIYSIPNSNVAGPIGRSIDIRPPQQILALIPGAHYERDTKGVTIWMPNEEHTKRLWHTITSMINEKQISMHSSFVNDIETNWLVWSIEDNNEVIESLYTVTLVSEHKRTGLRIDMIRWKRNEQIEDVSIGMRDNYNAQMTNILIAHYNRELRKEAHIKAEKLITNISISLGKDRSGLPVIIAWEPYDVFWEHVSVMLGECGFIIKERNHSQGTLTVKYKVPDDAFWKGINTKPLQFNRDNYNVQLGDLGNRTSINVTDSTGKPIKEEQLANFSLVLIAAVEHLTK
ncbi:outer membrane protein assembly factor BamC [Candidatus Enterovibrio altilux]|uniref:outer membrane protein assembly factor BamC n=1 Tax=Candidatus Enterovibrio altilux TaxID=1927128 RepID=UPI000BBCB0CE|nr:outer membrane protein assembly factor BamC [Candidatus Enterovibrio luxaltus]